MHATTPSPCSSAPSAGASLAAHPPANLPAWGRLRTLAAAPQPHLRDRLTVADAARDAALRFEAAGLRLDATRQAVDLPIWHALLALAREADVAGQAEALRRGEAINATEGRAALHPALRGDDDLSAPWGPAISAAVRDERERFLAAAERVRSGTWHGHRGLPIRTVVNLGIGGSDLGPRMATAALAALATPTVAVRYVPNADAWTLHEALRDLNPHETLFVVQSKSFTTPETRLMADTARRWLSDAELDPAAQAAHLVAVTARPDLARAQGFDPAHIFVFWDWVGGRYSVWSAIGFPLAVAIGAASFRQLLAGARAMDAHFWHAPAERNLPLALALLSVWNRDFLRCPTHLVAVYAERLRHFVPYVQQLAMESNGKRVHRDGTACAVGTEAIVWGGVGLEGQHAYFQLLHQGRHRVPVDFIGVDTEDTPLPLAARHHRLMRDNLLAQAQALALGRDEAQTRAQLRAEGLDAQTVKALTPHRTFPGNVPSNLLWLPRLDAHALGALMAAYEHKVFCEAAIWDIQAYDQWGVELGKTLLHTLARSDGAAG
ncbi:MAG: glucose-6-phosphate isomerase [Tepidimonas sp.]|uniref:glucose-6-phosphate isomerase n=1 Tax=Tepidimonas sp. TaxID=2002775 RepID=UPI00259DA425|nr:glucose-6-phosphate isomerase [Tepidimonas sp.]MDM7455955.1 glucose-6-phosphate isomerase [Tepidimonas sp.]